MTETEGIQIYAADDTTAVYKNFDAVLDSVKAAGLASEVARLKARFVIKDGDMSLKGAAWGDDAIAEALFKKYSEFVSRYNDLTRPANQDLPQDYWQQLRQMLEMQI